MDLSICVFCASSSKVDATHFDVSRRLGEQIAARRDTLVYGGGNIGLMGVMAEACREGGGRVVGVIPQSLKNKELAYEKADELIVCDDMRDRKTIMERRSDAFIALPGGFGTLEELMEIITLRQLHCHDKPVVILNVGGFYDGLLAFFDQLFDQHFIKAKHRGTYAVAADVSAAMASIDATLHAVRGSG